MRVCRCTRCQAAVDIEQHSCTHCGALLGYVPEQRRIGAFEDHGEAGWHPLGAPEIGVRLPCSNYGEHPICNWTVSAQAPSCRCESCRATANMPHLRSRDDHRRWARIERAKRRLFIGLREFDLIDKHGLVIGQPVTLFDVVLAEPAADTALVQAAPNGLSRIDLMRVDRESDASLFAALRRALGLRLWLDRARLPLDAARLSALFGDIPGAVADADRALAAWDFAWSKLEANTQIRANTPSAAAPGESAPF